MKRYVQLFGFICVVLLLAAQDLNAGRSTKQSNKMQEIIQQYYKIYDQGDDRFFTAFVAPNFTYYRMYSMTKGKPNNWKDLQSDLSYYRKMEKKSFSYEQIVLQDNMAVYETTFTVAQNGIEAELKMQDVFYFNANNQIQSIENYVSGFDLDELLPPTFISPTAEESAIVTSFFELLNKQDTNGLGTFLPEDFIQYAIYSGMKTKHDKAYYINTVAMQRGFKSVQTTYSVEGKSRKKIYVDAVQTTKDGWLYFELPMKFKLEIQEETIQVLTIELLNQ